MSEQGAEPGPKRAEPGPQEPDSPTVGEPGEDLPETPDIHGAYPHLDDAQIAALSALGQRRATQPGEDWRWCYVDETFV